MNIIRATSIALNDKVYKYQQAPAENDLIREMLPTEIIHRILSYVDKKEIESMVIVSLPWKVISIEVAQHEAASKIKKMIEFLSANLDDRRQGVQKAKLLSLQDKINFLDSTNLEEIKTLIYALKRSILEILVSLNKRDLKTLEGFKKPNFFENLFYLALIYTQGYMREPKPKGTLLNYEEESDLKYFSEQLLKNEDVYDAIIIAEMLSDALLKGIALQNICETLAQRGKFNKAKEVAEKISSNDIKIATLKSIALIEARRVYKYHQAPVENDLIGEILPTEVIHRILSYVNKKSIESIARVSRRWKVISIEVAQHEAASKIKKMIEILSENLDDLYNDDTQKQYERHFYEHRKHHCDIQKAKLLCIRDGINFSDSSSLAEIRTRIYTLKKSILRILIDFNKNELEILEKLFANMVNKPMFFENLFYLTTYYKTILPAFGLEKLIQRENIYDAIIIAEIIKKNRLLKGAAFQTISKLLVEKGKLKKAKEFAEVIRDDHLKGTVFQTISEKLAQKGKFKKAKKLASRIYDDGKKTETLRNINNTIAEKAIEQTDTKKALKIATRLDSFDRNRIFEQLSKALARKGELIKALDVAEMLGKEHITALKRIRTLEQLSEALARKGTLRRDEFRKGDEFRETLEVAQRTGIQYYTAIKEIFSIAIKQDKTTETRKIAYRIVLRFDEIKNLLSIEGRIQFFNKERSLLLKRALQYIDDTNQSKVKVTFKKTKKAAEDGLSKIFRKN